jgi:opacity protein-like surface antigen
MKGNHILVVLVGALGFASPLGAAISLELAEGIRHDRLTLSNSGFGGHPTTVSELMFKSHRIYNTSLALKMQSDRVFFRVEGSYGTVHDATLRDQDFGKDHHRDLWCSTDRALSHCYTADASATIGLITHPTTGLTLSPALGYRFDYAKFGMEDSYHKQLVHQKNLDLRLDHLHSWQRSFFDAPFVGTDFSWQLLPRLSLFGDAYFLFAVKYHGKAYWNLRKTHFHESSRRENGFGEKAALGLSYELFSHFFIKAQYNESYLNARKGTMSYRHRHNHGQVPFHRARFLSQEVRLGIEYLF